MTSPADDGRVQVMGYWHDAACLVARHAEYAVIAAQVNDDFPWCTCYRRSEQEAVTGE